MDALASGPSLPPDAIELLDIREVRVPAHGPLIANQGINPQVGHFDAKQRTHRAAFPRCVPRDTRKLANDVDRPRAAHEESKELGLDIRFRDLTPQEFR
jgi:hypothetical protein